MVDSPTIRSGAIVQILNQNPVWSRIGGAISPERAAAEDGELDEVLAVPWATALETDVAVAEFVLGRLLGRVGMRIGYHLALVARGLVDGFAGFLESMGVRAGRKNIIVAVLMVFTLDLTARLRHVVQFATGEVSGGGSVIASQDAGVC